MAQLLNIDGEDVEVMSYLWSKKDQDIDSGRNLAGYMERNVLDHSVITLKVTLPPQNQYERQQIINLIDKKSMTVKCLSPKTNRVETHKMYHGDIDSEVYWNVKNNDNDDEILYTAFSIQLVEY